MTESVYKVIELVGTSSESWEKATEAAVGRAAQTLRDLRIAEVSELVRERSGYALEPYKPVTGENLFVRESGAVAAQFHDPSAIEPYSSQITGARRGIVLGKKSGIASIEIKLDELGIEVPEERRAELLAEVKIRGAAKQGIVTDDEFRQLAAGVGEGT